MKKQKNTFSKKVYQNKNKNQKKTKHKKNAHTFFLNMGNILPGFLK